MIIAVIDNMTEIPDSCYECSLTEYESGNCSILKQSEQQIRPYNCPLLSINSSKDISALNENYTKKFKEIESHLNCIKQLQNEMKELVDKIEARPIVDSYPHLDRDGCVYWDSILVKKEKKDG